MRGWMLRLSSTRRSYRTPGRWQARSIGDRPLTERHRLQRLEHRGLHFKLMCCSPSAPHVYIPGLKKHITQMPSTSNMRKFITCLILLPTFSMPQSIAGTDTIQSGRDKEKLAPARNFSLGMVRFYGHTSENEKIYRKILKSRNAAEHFTQIIRSEESTNEAKLYAACGLRTLSLTLFRNEIQNILKNGGTASVLRADTLNKEEMTSLIESIDKFGCNQTTK